MAHHGFRLLRRRVGAALADALRVQHGIAVADDGNAVLAGDLLPASAGQWADPIGPGPHRVECIEAGQLDVEAGAGMLVELIERFL